MGLYFALKLRNTSLKRGRYICTLEAQLPTISTLHTIRKNNIRPLFFPRKQISRFVHAALARLLDCLQLTRHRRWPPKRHPLRRRRRRRRQHRPRSLRRRRQRPRSLLPRSLPLRRKRRRRLRLPPLLRLLLLLRQSLLPRKPRLLRRLLRRRYCFVGPLPDYHRCVDFYSSFDQPAAKKTAPKKAKK